MDAILHVSLSSFPVDTIHSFPAKLYNFNFHPLEVVSR